MIEYEKKPDYFFAFFLILLGTLLLLNTTGTISWGVWITLLKFWPLFIIFAGLNLIAQDNKVAKIIIGIFSIIVFILAFLWSWNITEEEKFSKSLNIDIPKISREEKIQKEILIPTTNYNNVKKQNINIEMGAGSLNISNNNVSENIVLESEYVKGFGKPKLEEKIKENILNLNYNLGEKEDISLFNLNFDNAPKYNMILGENDIPTDLFLNLGAGSTSINIDEYRLENLKFEIGAGKVDTSLSNIYLEDLEIDLGAGNFEMFLKEDIEIKEKIFIKIGAGNLVLNLPKDLAYEIDGNVGIGEIVLREKSISGLGKNLEKFKSENYYEAEKRIKIKVDVGVGKLSIK